MPTKAELEDQLATLEAENAKLKKAAKGEESAKGEKSVDVSGVFNGSQGGFTQDIKVRREKAKAAKKKGKK